ncbi:hypothetical protein SCOR_06225 [Sulfidibacter corallicola]
MPDLAPRAVAFPPAFFKPDRQAVLCRCRSSYDPCSDGFAVRGCRFPFLEAYFG